MLRASFVSLLCVAGIHAQVSNDTCSTAAVITTAVVSGTNVGATTGPDPLPACATMNGDVWYSWIAPCGGTYTASTCASATNFSTIVAVWDGAGGCGALAPIACSDVCVSGPFQGASATFTAVGGSHYFISVGGNFGSAGSFELSLRLGAAMTLVFFTNGPGSLGYVVGEGPENGIAFVAVTLNAGNFPVGWFLGIDIAWSDLINELTIGYPFVISLQSCGQAAIGPFWGLPSGLPVFAVGLALPPGGAVPVAMTLPALGVVP